MHTIDTTTSDPPIGQLTARHLRDTAARCSAAADVLDPGGAVDPFPIAEAATLEVDVEPRSVQWAVMIDGHEVLLTWASYAIAGSQWSTWLDSDNEDDRRLWQASTAAEAVAMVTAGIVERVPS